VNGESRDAVIALDGGSLFVSGRAEILPGARQKLNDVADALKQGEGEQAIWVKDYSDSLASSQANRRLSQQRAEAVRSYLLSRGVRPELVTAQGKGERNRLSSSDTAYGVTNHEHVEIVVLSNASISRQ
jgi:outer membrane protein OmpA-like peptidoglycan-associated protein